MVGWLVILDSENDLTGLAAVPSHECERTLKQEGINLPAKVVDVMLGSARSNLR